MPRKPAPSWAQVADKIVREDLSITQAARHLGIELPADQLEETFRSKEFQTILWKTRLDYYTEIGNNPGRTKAAALGLMTLALKNLAAEGEWEKVIEGVLKLAKVEGWVGGESNVNVFANLTAKDIQAEIDRIKATIDTGTPETPKLPIAN